MMKPIRISILDQSVIKQNGTAREAIEETVRMAQLGDRLGFTRFWVSEHHNLTRIASGTPEILIGKLAENTKRIRIGAGGIMLPNHSALKVAETFRMLEVLYPNRIDLGLGRASGTDPMTAYILNPANDFNEDSFPRKLNELQAFLSDSASTSRGTIIAVPQIETTPQQWILTGGATASLAAKYGLGLSLPHFIQPVYDQSGVKRYRDEFIPSKEFPVSQVSMGIAVICAHSSERAELLKRAALLAMYSLRTTGRIDQMPAPEDLANYSLSAQQESFINTESIKYIVGTPSEVKEQIHKLVEKYDLDEVIATMFSHSYEEKRLSFELLAEVMEINTYEMA
jgi:luciferase family oxidoreductase group 1